MSFPRYPEYKDSGVEWLGEVPAHWEVRPLKASFRIVGGSTPIAEEDNWGGEVVWVTPADLSSLPSMEISFSSRSITKEGLASCGATLVPRDSLVLSTRAPIGSLAIASVPLCTNQGCKSLVPGGGIDSRFFAYLLSNSTKALNVRGKGTTFLEISGDELGAFRVPVPLPHEQSLVARFLDHEVGRIHSLIEEQRRLIELLNEKRQAVISHTVTKGLDPNVPMKDSGVEWLGKVPLHWDVSRLKFYGELVTGITPPTGELDNFSDSGWPWIRPGDLENSVFPTKASSFLTDKGRKYCRQVAPGSSLVCCIGTIGKLGYIDEVACTNQQITAVEPFFGNKYVFFMLGAAKSELDIGATGNVLRILNSERLGNVRVPMPRESEAIKIAGFLDRRNDEIDVLIQASIDSIALLKERRGALISAAVTGKIDVRGWSGDAESEESELPMVADQDAGYSARGGAA